MNKDSKAYKAMIDNFICRFCKQQLDPNDRVAMYKNGKLAHPYDCITSTLNHRVMLIGSPEAIKRVSGGRNA